MKAEISSLIRINAGQVYRIFVLYLVDITVFWNGELLVQDIISVKICFSHYLPYNEDEVLCLGFVFVSFSKRWF